MKNLLNYVLPILFTFLLSNFVHSQDIAMAIMPATSNVSISKTLIKVSEKETLAYSTLISAIKVADLEEILENGTFTFFAPSDDAFKKLPKGKLEQLINSKNKKELRALLTYHIVAGEFSAAKILRDLCRGEGTKTYTTLQGGKITATIQGVNIILTDNLGNSAAIVKADNAKCNGVIHVIDNIFPVK